MKQTSFDVAVIGGGPSGMMAAGRAAELGASVVLLEKNSHLGVKLLMTGGGRSNVTNAEPDIRKLLEHYKENGKFLFSAFSQWRTKETLNFFESRGMETKVENEGRVFPTSDSSASVLDVLVSYMKEGNVTVKTSSAVKQIMETNGIVTSVITANCEEIFARSFVIATGGVSYPKTGSTGDGFNWLQKLGHEIAKPDSALVPVRIRDAWVKDLQGVTLPNIRLSLMQDDKKIQTKKGKILFTHFGVSGPTVINMSRNIQELLPYGDVFILLDLLPDHDFSSLNTALQDLFKTHINKKLKNALPELIGSALTPVVMDMMKIDNEKNCNSVTRDERILLMHLLKGLKMRVLDLLGPENAIVSSGGVLPTEVDWKTMRSKIIPNLYLTGDILNINRPSGGFSLQLCWTTGFVSGTNSVGS